jgi:hypothetical protein
MSDLDRGAALLHLHKREWEGTEYAVEHYPAKYFDHPALTTLSSDDACRHAASLEEIADNLMPEEYDRLYDAAPEADRRRS